MNQQQSTVLTYYYKQPIKEPQPTRTFLAAGPFVPFRRRPVSSSVDAVCHGRWWRGRSHSGCCIAVGLILLQLLQLLKLLLLVEDLLLVDLLHVLLVVLLLQVLDQRLLLQATQTLRHAAQVSSSSQ